MCNCLFSQPIFLDISQIWKQLQDETVLLSVLTNTLSGIQSNFVGRRLIWKREKLLHLISDSEIQFDDDRKVSYTKSLWLPFSLSRLDSVDDMDVWQVPVYKTSVIAKMLKGKYEQRRNTGWSSTQIS